MKKQFRLIFFVLLSVHFGLFASTTEKIRSDAFYNVGPGDLELDFIINGTFIQTNNKLNVFTFQVGTNYFISKIWAPGIELFIQDNNGSSEFRFLPNVKAYWPDLGRVLPYVQLGLGLAHLPGGGGLDLRFAAGINYLLTKSVAIGISSRYDLINSSGSNTHRFQVPVGLQFYFNF